MASGQYPLNPAFIDKVKLVWVKLLSSPLSKLSTNVMRECCLYLPGDLQRVLIFRGDKVLYLDTNVGIWKDWVQLPRAIPNNYEFSALFVGLDLLFVTGMKLEDSTVHAGSFGSYLLSPEGVCDLPEMQQRRLYAGVCADWIMKTVYVFGGLDNSAKNRLKLTSTESILLEKKNWTALASMDVPRSHFNPVNYERNIYLAGGVSTAIEVYQVESNTFRTLRPTLCSDYANGGSCTVLRGDCLVILCRTYICSVRISTEELVGGRQHPAVNILPRCWPIIRNRKIYVIDWRHVCSVINADTGAVETVYDYNRIVVEP